MENDSSQTGLHGSPPPLWYKRGHPARRVFLGCSTTGQGVYCSGLCSDEYHELIQILASLNLLLEVREADLDFWSVFLVVSPLLQVPKQSISRVCILAFLSQVFLGGFDARPET